MAGQTYQITVNTQQAQQAIQGLQTQLGRMNTTVSGVGKSFEGLNALFRVGAAATAAKGFQTLADQSTSLRNRLLTLGKSQEEVNGLFKDLVTVSNTARTPLAATGDLFYRIARNADNLGVSMGEALSITESVSKAISASGISAAEAAGPLLQLGQALQSGRLQGDELRSILEGLPPVARAVANSLGVPIGALRELGAAGVISSRDVIKALQEARATIDREFANTAPTIGQSFTVLQNSIIGAVGELDKATGGSRAVAAAIVSLANNVQKASDFFKEFGSQISSITNAVVTFLKYAALIGGVVALFSPIGRVLVTVYEGFAGLVAIARNLIGVFKAGGFAALGTVFKNIGVNLSLLTGLASKLGAVLRNIFPQSVAEFIIRNLKAVSVAIAAAIASVLDFFGFSSEKIPEMEGDFYGISEALENMAEKAELTGEAFKRLFAIEFGKQLRAYQQANKELEDQYSLQLALVGVSETNRNLIASQTDAWKNYQDQLKQLAKQYGDLEEAARRSNDAQSPDSVKFRAFQQEYSAMQAKLRDEYEKSAAALLRLAEATETATRAENLRQFNIRETIAQEKALRKVQDDIAKIGLTSIEQGYYDIAAAARESARAAIEAEEARRGSALDPAEAEQYYRKAAEGARKLINENKRLSEQSRTFAAGWQRAFRQYVEDATNAAARAERMFEKFTSGLEDLIVGFAKTGKFEWKSFVDSMLEELLRSQIRETIASLGSAFGLGGLFGSIGGATQQRGNSANNPLYVLDIAGGSGFGVSKNNPLISGGGIGGGSASGGGFLGDLAKIGTSIWDGVKSVGSSIFGGISDLFGGFFANGGTLGAGKWGIAGENGPEVISGPASITPMGGMTSVTYNINAVDAASFKQLVASDPSFIFAVTEQGRRSLPQGRR